MVGDGLHQNTKRFPGKFPTAAHSTETPRAGQDLTSQGRKLLGKLSWKLRSQEFSVGPGTSRARPLHPAHPELSSHPLTLPREETTQPGRALRGSLPFSHPVASTSGEAGAQSSWHRPAPEPQRCPARGAPRALLSGVTSGVATCLESNGLAISGRCKGETPVHTDNTARCQQTALLESRAPAKLQARGIIFPLSGEVPLRGERVHVCMHFPFTECLSARSEDRWLAGCQLNLATPNSLALLSHEAEVVRTRQALLPRSEIFCKNRAERLLCAVWKLRVERLHVPSHGSRRVAPEQRAALHLSGPRSQRTGQMTGSNFGGRSSDSGGQGCNLARAAVAGQDPARVGTESPPS